MLDQRRFRRLGVTSAVTVGAFAFLLGGAGPADAATHCAKGHDPKSTIASIACQLREAANNLQKQIDKLKRQNQPQTPPPQVKPPTPNPTAKTSPPATKSSTRTGTTTTRTGSTGLTGPASLPGSVQPYTAGSTTAQLPGLLPQVPQVADQLPASSVLTETHLVTPMAAQVYQPQHVVWVAGAAGLAGVVGAMNLTMVGRRRRPAR